MTILRCPFTTKASILKSMTPLFALRKSTLKNCSCANSLHAYPTCSSLVPQTLICSVVVRHTPCCLLFAPRIGRLARCSQLINPLVSSVAVRILLWQTLDDFTRQWETGHRRVNRLHVSQTNPLVASCVFSILFWLTPDDFTRQWETSCMATRGLVLNLREVSLSIIVTAAPVSD